MNLLVQATALAKGVGAALNVIGDVWEIVFQAPIDPKDADNTADALLGIQALAEVNGNVAVCA